MASMRYIQFNDGGGQFVRINRISEVGEAKTFKPERRRRDIAVVTATQMNFRAPFRGGIIQGSVRASCRP
jgi:hypothetical protein